MAAASLGNIHDWFVICRDHRAFFCAWHVPIRSHPNTLRQIAALTRDIMSKRRNSVPHSENPTSREVEEFAGEFVRLFDFLVRYEPALFKSLWACFSAFFASALQSASGLSAWIALLKLIALSLVALHDDISVLECTPVRFDLKQLKS